MIANLVHHYHLSMSDILKLTDKQIKEIYFHPRNDKDEIEPVEERRSGSLEADLYELDMLLAKGVIKITEEKKAELKDKLRKKWQTRKAK